MSEVEKPKYDFDLIMDDNLIVGTDEAIVEYALMMCQGDNKVAMETVINQCFTTGDVVTLCSVTDMLEFIQDQYEVQLVTAM